jgi:hypothetical protein
LVPVPASLRESVAALISGSPCSWRRRGWTRWT